MSAAETYSDGRRVTFQKIGDHWRSPEMATAQIDPKSDPGMNVGNAPIKMDDMQMCNSKMQANHYSVFDKVDATVAWYTAHLAGFHKTHAYFNNSSQNKFYNDAGTLVVWVQGERGQDGQNVDTHAVTYYRFQPGLSAKTILSFGQQKIECR
jgi:hypothetical protein